MKSSSSPEPSAMRKISCSSFSPLGNEREYLLKCFDSGWITQGVFVKQCERMLAEMSGRKHAVVCSSGTAALHLGLLALNVLPGDGVIVPASTYVATANVVRYVGAKPLFCDVLPGSWCLDPVDVFRKARAHIASGGRIAGVIPVHMYGVDPSNDEFGQYGWVLSDASQAAGKELPPLSTLSFYASKIVASGEGGAFLTDDGNLAARARLFRGQGAPVAGKYDHIVVGHNYRMTDLQASILLAQLESYPSHASHRAELVERYEHWLGGSPLEFQEKGEEAADWVFPVLLPKPNSEVVAEEMSRRGIETRPFFMPLPAMLPYRELGDRSQYPVSYDIFRRGLVLPLHSGMSPEDVDYVAGSLLEMVR